MAELPEAYLRWLWDTVDLREPLLGAVTEALEVYSCHVPARIEDARTIYHDLAKKWHPDAGGTKEAMQAVNEFYERLKGKR